VWKFSQGTGGGYTQLRYNGGAGSDAPTTVVVGSVPGSLTTGSLAPTPVGSLSALSGTSTFDTGVDVTTGAFNGTGGATLNLTSGTNSDIVVTGPSTLTGTGTVTINPNTAAITFNNGISGAGVGLTFNGSYLATFKAANTYSGTTTVSGGRLVLDSAGGNSVAGNLTVNAANALGRVRNVVLNQSNQIADSATVNVTSGILDIGANSETIGTLTVNGPTAEVIGSGGTLTAATLDLRAGLVSANLAGSTGLNKNTAGTIALVGTNTYTGQTTISSGALNVRSNAALGAVGAGNDTIVSAGGQLQVQGNVNLAEAITLNGNSSDGTGSLRGRGGLNTLAGAVSLASSTTIQVDAGELFIAIRSAEVAQPSRSKVTGLWVSLAIQRSVASPS
jgi:autotransporter-associated beta strand protein